VNRKELSAVVAECAARAERAAALQRQSVAKAEAARAGVEAARKRQEEAVGRQEAEREDEKIWREEYLRRQERLFQDFFARADAAAAEGRDNTEKILARIDDLRDDFRAVQEAIMKLIDRLPPPPPHLRSA
jgi:hypothetical protein